MPRPTSEGSIFNSKFGCVVALKEGIRSGSENLGHTLHHFIGSIQLRLNFGPCLLTALLDALIHALAEAFIEATLMARSLAILMSLLGTIDRPGGFRHKAPYPRHIVPNYRAFNDPDMIKPNTPLNAAPLGFPANPEELAVHADGIWVLTAHDGGAADLAPYGVIPVPIP